MHAFAFGRSLVPLFAIWILSTGLAECASDLEGPALPKSLDSNEDSPQRRHFDYSGLAYAHGNAEPVKVIKVDVDINYPGGDFDVPPAAQPSLAGAESTTLIPVSPFTNDSQAQDTTTTMTLPNGDLLEIEQHVDIAFGMAESPKGPTREESIDSPPGPPHVISLPVAALAESQTFIKQLCRTHQTVTVTRTVQITSIRTRTSTRLATSTRTITRTHTPAAPSAPPVAQQVRLRVSAWEISFSISSTD